jgi:Tol biopolymer transport system component
MRQLAISAASFAMLLLLAIAVHGCGGTTTTSGSSPWNPSPPVNPGQPATGMVAFIEDINGDSAGSFVPSTEWKEQAATLPGDNTATRNLYVMKNNGTGIRKLNNQPADFHSVSMLPDGSKLVFAAHALDGYSQIYFVDLASKTFAPVQLTSTPGHKMDPMLSADGTKVVFMYANLDSNRFDVAIMNADGSNLYVIPTLPNWYIWHPAISPDGTKIAMERWNANDDIHSVFIMDTDGGNLTKLTNFGFAGYPAFSVDGKQLVFSSMTYSLDVFTINVDGSGMHHVSEGCDATFVGNSILFVGRPGPDYGIDQIYSDSGGRLTNNTYNDAFEMTI